MTNPYIRLTADHKFSAFDCGDKDLNEFLLNDSRHYLRELLAVTYYLQAGDEIIVYFTLSNDKLSASEQTKGFWRRIKRTVPHEKHRKDYPAVKIGRFAVADKYRNTEQHWGTQTLDFIKQWMVTGNKTGCRFITVDAYKAAVEFYLKNKFVFMGHEEEERYLRDNGNPRSEGTYAMYYDLSNMIEN